MRAYRKTSTRHRFCLYLTEDEAARFLEEQTCVDLERLATVAQVNRSLSRVFDKWEEER
jgi:hypothetical protein